MNMILRLSLITLLSVVLAKTYGQVELRTELIGSSRYTNGSNIKTTDKGSAKVFSLNAKIPLSVEVDENQKPVKVWGLGVAAEYTTFSNGKIADVFGPDKIVNANLSLYHLRPMSEKWSILATLGVGVYTSHTDLSKVGFHNLMANGGVIFVRHIKNNLDVGLGPVINTLLGYPMVFPGVYVKWKTNGDYEVNVSMFNGLEASAGKRFSEQFKLDMVAAFNGSMALETKNNKKLMFTHQYFYTGLQPEINLGEGWSISAIAGLAAGRTAYYQERTLKSIFKSDDNVHHPHFGAAPYGSLSLKLDF
ncbi:DUF6268 family outer membrane beta-barrel protein [Arachidicoccus terrestris]|uniref:DUF6268 family outer membrane beta-barrel protein n=1 Tax=Arachidicoccus terrestris TaxID=2875539 RepID=UPI001CC6B706|nr:DUF6268 family outer membrane beta-barrel protein [Arachidicoccus terrestris]UAY56547.1 DUF6268 family outer membrane beta-barrel protein [Arachidicoccus terrestris]